VTPPPRAAGFTLVEMLVALLLFGMITAAGVALLSFSVRAQAIAGDQLDALASARRAGALIGSDLAQVMPRLTRDANGAVRSAFEGQGEGDAGTLMVFVRSSWDADGTRPAVQKIAYRHVGERLERVSYPQLDGAAPERTQILMDGVRSLGVRFRAEDGGWRDRWDPEEITALPLAVEMTVDAGGPGPVRQLFLVRTASP